jgi:hypothetical protein
LETSLNAILPIPAFPLLLPASMGFDLLTMS